MQQNRKNKLTMYNELQPFCSAKKPLWFQRIKFISIKCEGSHFNYIISETKFAEGCTNQSATSQTCSTDEKYPCIRAQSCFHVCIRASCGKRTFVALARTISMIVFNSNSKYKGRGKCRWP